MSESASINNFGDVPEPTVRTSGIHSRKPLAAERIYSHGALTQFVALVFFLLLSLSGARAFGAKSEVHIFCAGYASGLKTVYLKGSGENYQNVGLSIANVIELPGTHLGDGKITFYGAAGENGKRPVVAIADVKGVKQPLIVLYPSEQGAATAYGATTVDADGSKFRVSTFQLVNLSPHPVRITHDELVIELETLGARIFSPPKPLGKPLAITVDYKPKDDWMLLSSSSWVARNDRRTLVCALLDPLTGRMNLKSVPLRDYSGR